MNKPVKSRFNRGFLNLLIIGIGAFVLVLSQLPGERPSRGFLDTLDHFFTGTDTTATATIESSDDNTVRLTTLAEAENSSVTPRPLDIQQWQTEQGSRVVFMAAPEIPMLDIQLTFDAGSARDGQLPGLASLTSSMIGEATSKLTVDDINRSLEEVGAQLSTASYRDMGIITFRSLTGPTWLEPGLSLLLQILGDIRFPDENFDRLRQQMLVGLRYEQQNPGKVAGKAFMKALYGNHPYSIPSNGTEESLTAMTPADARAFFQRYYNRKNVIIAIVGAISETDARQLADRISHQLPEGSKAPPLPPVPLPEKQQITLEHPSTQTHVFMGLPTLERGNPDYAALSIGNDILGGNGFSSLLNQAIRQQEGLAYSVYSALSPMRSPGPFLINFQTRNDSRDKALAIAHDVLENFLRDGPDETQLQDAKKTVLNSYPMSIASNDDILGTISALAFYDMPMDWPERYIEQVKALSKEDVKTALNRYIRPEHLVTVMAGKGLTANGSQVEPQ